MYIILAVVVVRFDSGWLIRLSGDWLGSSSSKLPIIWWVGR